VNDIWQRAVAMVMDFKEVGLQLQEVGGSSEILRDGDPRTKASTS
jgi:hypothetical protein